MTIPAVVIDTNVLVAALRSQYGTSNRLLQLVGIGLFDVHLSVPVMLEYEEVLLRQLPHLPHTEADVHTLLDYLCQVGHFHNIHFLWRPTLRDPDDEMLLELAVTGGCDYIITHNTRDFAETRPFGIAVVTPRAFLQILEESS